MEAPLQRVAKKQKVLFEETQKQVGTWLEECQKNLSSLEAGEELSSKMIEDLYKLVSDAKTPTKFSKGQKELHVAIKKFGKYIEQPCEPINIPRLSRSVLKSQNNELDRNLLNTAIAHHFFREGRFNLGDAFVQESGIEFPFWMKEPLQEMHDISISIVSRDLDPAILWASSKRSELKSIGSDIEFEFHRLNYLKHLNDGRAIEALSYAKFNLVRFLDDKSEEINRLMSSLCFSGHLSNSPYRELILNDDHWKEIEIRFRGAYCRILGLPKHSPLSVCVASGAIALPQLSKAARLIKDPYEWEDSNRLPIPIDRLGPMGLYHPIFSCPVSKEQSTVDNPPVRIPCGHVLCKETMTKLTKLRTNRYKCPYCPGEGSPGEAQVVIF